MCHSSGKPGGDKVSMLFVPLLFLALVEKLCYAPMNAAKYSVTLSLLNTVPFHSLTHTSQRKHRHTAGTQELTMH